MTQSSPTYIWWNELAAQLIEGASDSFLIVMGGSAAGQLGTGAVNPVTLKQLGISIAVGAGLYGAAFLKKRPLPTVSIPAVPQLTPPLIPSPAP